MRIVATASETGFGPTAALTSFLGWASGVRNLNVTLDLPTKARALVPRGLCAGWNVTRINALDTAPSSCPQTRQRPESLLLNFGRTELFEQGNRWLRHVFVDCVGWLNAANHTSTGEPQDATLLLEAFPPMGLDDYDPAHAIIRPCIAQSSSRPARREHILVSFGGGTFPGLSSTCHPMLAIQKELSAQATTARLRNELIFSGLTGDREAAVRIYPIDVHRQLVSQAAVVVTVPGLYTVFEALQEARPVVFLPPTNYTQMVQYGWYRRNGVVPARIDWCAILGLPDIAAEAIPLDEEQRFVRNLWLTLANPEVIREIAHHTVAIIRAIVAGMMPYPRSLTKLLVSKYLGCRHPSLGSVLDGIVSRTFA
jgi:hypothetical protein